MRCNKCKYALATRDIIERQCTQKDCNNSLITSSCGGSNICTECSERESICQVCGESLDKKITT